MQERDYGCSVFLSPDGRDSWSGALEKPNGDGTDGPLATIGRAQEILRDKKLRGELPGPMTVLLRGGRYFIDSPIVFGPEDSMPVTFAAYPGEKPVVDAGTRLENWREETVNGVGVWVCDVPGALKQQGGFKQLFAADMRCRRARFPKKGFYWIEDVPRSEESNGRSGGTKQFQCREGDIRAWKNLADVEVVALHWWVEERMPIESFDEKTRIVTSTRMARSGLKDQKNPFAKYYVENVFEALGEPGEWYLDRTEWKVYYVPRRGEVINRTEIFAGRLSSFLHFEGEALNGRYVEYIRFEGIGFEHSDWKQPCSLDLHFEQSKKLGRKNLPLDQAMAQIAAKEAGHDSANTGQSSAAVPGAIVMEGARYCTIEDCAIRHVGYYAVEIAGGSSAVRIIGNTIEDIGGGGVKINGSTVDEPAAQRTGNNIISDNNIVGLGRVFYGASGILLMHTFGNYVVHNNVEDLYYTGISVGYLWGYMDNVTRENRIEKNHVHDIGHGILDDMAGIYLLGVQPGTAIRNNLVHNIDKANYGGFGLNLDEGVAHVVVENNIFYNTSSQSFHQHFGRENILRNNIFAFSDEGMLALSRGNRCRWTSKGAFGDGSITCAFTFERNIVLTDNQPVFLGGLADETGYLESRSFVTDLNVFWDCGGKDIYFGNGVHGKGGRESLNKAFDWVEWQAMGYDTHSIVADPKFADAAQGDFTLGDDSPARALGFEPIDMSDVGPRPKEKRKAVARGWTVTKEETKYAYW